jgi:hypothetical protein
MFAVFIPLLLHTASSRLRVSGAKLSASKSSITILFKSNTNFKRAFIQNAVKLTLIPSSPLGEALRVY